MTTAGVGYRVRVRASRATSRPARNKVSFDYIVDPLMSGAEAVGSAAGGDFRPAMEMAERAGRGALKFASAFDPMGNAYEPTAREQDPRIAELQQRQAARQEPQPHPQAGSRPLTAVG